MMHASLDDWGSDWKMHSLIIIRDIHSKTLFFQCTLQILQKSEVGRGLWPSEAGAGALQPGARPGGEAQPGQEEARHGDQAQEPRPQLLQVSTQISDWEAMTDVFQRIGSATIPGTADHKTCKQCLIIGRRDNFFTKVSHILFAIYWRSLTPRLPSGEWAGGAGPWWTRCADQTGRGPGRPSGDPGHVTCHVSHNPNITLQTGHQRQWDGASLLRNTPSCHGQQTSLCDSPRMRAPEKNDFVVMQISFIKYLSSLPQCSRQPLPFRMHQITHCFSRSPTWQALRRRNQSEGAWAADRAQSSVSSRSGIVICWAQRTLWGLKQSELKKKTAQELYFGNGCMWGQVFGV